MVFTPAAVRLNTYRKGHVLPGEPWWLFQPHREAEKGGEHAREVGEGRLVGSDQLGRAQGTGGFTPRGESTFWQPDRKGEGWWQMRSGGQGCRGPFQRPPVGRGSLCDSGKAGRGHAMQEGQATNFLNPDSSITHQLSESRGQRPAVAEASTHGTCAPGAGSPDAHCIRLSDVSQLCLCSQTMMPSQWGARMALLLARFGQSPASGHPLLGHP